MKEPLAWQDAPSHLIFTKSQTKHKFFDLEKLGEGQLNKKRAYDIQIKRVPVKKMYVWPPLHFWKMVNN